MPDVTAAPACAAPVHPRLGPYELLDEIGRGGMGRVFRARDTRLGRDVALKLLDRHAGEPRRVRRFLAEARAAGALNHPNILAVHDVSTDTDQPYIVTELIDGGSLRRELDGGAMPMARVLDLASQVADGLAAAHQARLVHRDLKPENVMIARGRAKVVDFGLVKDAEPVDGEGGPAQTVTAPHAILGTPPYMSPEQARGAVVDHRSDQFSFGAMLYEMATGQRAFARATAIETLTALQHDEPAPMRGVNPRVPERLQEIVERCLAKAPDDRYASTSDLYHDLKALRDGRVPTGAAAPARGGVFGAWRRRVPSAALATAGVVAVALVAMVTAPPPGRDLGQYRIVPVATDPGYEGAPAWSPNGQSLAYIAERDGVLQVMVRSLDSARSTQVTRAVSDCRSPMWAPDGSRVYYLSLAGTEDSLWSVSSAGGTPRVELRGVSAATLAPDGGAVVFVRDGGAFNVSLWRSAPIGREPVPFAPSWRGALAELRFSPDGATVGVWDDADDAVAGHPVFTAINYPAGTTRKVLQSLPLQSRSHPFSWMRDSRRIVFGADLLGRSPGTHLWVADTETGDVEALTASSTSEYEPAVSPDGSRVAFVADASHYDVVEIPIAPGPMVPRSTTASDDSDPVWSPTGRQFAYVTTRTGRPELWLRDVEGAVEVPLVTRRNLPKDTFLLSRPAISPDGQRVAFQHRDADGYFVWTMPMAGGQAVPVVYRSAEVSYADAPTWSPSGEWLAFTYLAPLTSGREQSWRLGKARPGAPDIVELRRDVNFLTAPQWSPDGRWITAELADGLYALSPEPSAGTEATAQRLLSHEPWLVHTWARDSRSVLAVRQSDDNRLQLASIDLETQAVRVLNADLGPVPPTTPPLKGFSLSPDGTRLLTAIARLRGDIHVLDGFEVPRGWWPGVTSRLSWRRATTPTPP